MSQPASASIAAAQPSVPAAPLNTARVCRVCGNERGNTSYRVPGMMTGLGGEFDYFMCAECDCLQNANPPPAFLRGYPEGYRYFRGAPRSNPVVRALKRARDRYQLTGKGRLGRILAAFASNDYMRDLNVPGLSRHWRVLEIGAGEGVALEGLADLGFRDLQGVDPGIPGDFRTRSGVPIRQGFATDMDGEFDLIVSTNTMEHVLDPRETMDAIARLLSPNGVAVLNLPVVPSLAWETYGVYWLQLGAPRHVFLHSVKSITLLAERAGLRVERVEYASNSTQFEGSEEHRHAVESRRRNPDAEPVKPTFSRSQKREWRRMSARVNADGRGDQAVFYLRPTATEDARFPHRMAGERQPAGV